MTPLRVMAPMQFGRILAGGEHTCAIADTIVCWGRNDVGQVVGPNPTQIPPTTNNPFFFQQLGGGVSVVTAALSAHSTCIVTSTGQAQCWGTGYPIPGAIAPADRLAAGHGHLCSMTKQVVSCKGTGNWGEQGNGSTSFQANPTPVLTPPALYMDLSAGDSHTCGLTPDGDAFCWGRNTAGQVGNGTSSVTGINRPTRVVHP